MTEGVFNGYKGDTANYTIEEKQFFESIRDKFSQLSDKEKYQLKARFIAGDFFGIGGRAVFGSQERFKDHFNTDYFKAGLSGFLKKSGNRYR